MSLEEQDTTVLEGKLREDKEMNSAIKFTNVTASWESSQTLTNLNFQVEKGKLCAIIGPVGSGKSSLFQLILGEMPSATGEIFINGNISYASQEAWLFTSTVRDNILFGLPYNEPRYNDTVKYCALEADFQQLHYGDKTYVGERGASLSGGQKARISLARAVYRKALIYLLDDPLSAVDAHVGKHLFSECIGPNGYLAREKATRILITHQIHFLKEADWIIVLDKGAVIKQGTWNDVMDKNLQRYISSEDDQEASDISSQTAIACDDESDDEIPFIDAPEITKGYLKLQTSDSDLKAIEGNKEDMEIEEQKLARTENRNEAKIRFAKVFVEYFRAGASIPALLCFMLFLVFSQVVTSGSDYFINIWTNQEFLRTQNEETFFTTNQGLYIYGTLIVAVVMVTLSRGFIFFSICMCASKKLHDESFLCLLHSPMKFFDLNTVGRILNRFSKDMGTVDELLPKAIIEAIQV